jgi:hypothetical protein
VEAGLIYTHVLAAILAAALAGWAGWSVQGWRLGEQIATIKAAQIEAVNAATREARATESRRFVNVMEAQNAATKRAQVARSDADHARTELSRLRDAIAARPVCVPGDTAGSGPQRTDTAGLVLSECGQALTDLAATADRLHADRMMLLESWPR